MAGEETALHNTSVERNADKTGRKGMKNTSGRMKSLHEVNILGTVDPAPKRYTGGPTATKKTQLRKSPTAGHVGNSGVEDSRRENKLYQETAI